MEEGWREEKGMDEGGPRSKGRMGGRGREEQGEDGEKGGVGTKGG